MALDDASAVAHVPPPWHGDSHGDLPIGRRIEFVVSGLPVPQGSMRAFVVKGRPVITSGSKALGAWRQLVALRAQELAAPFFDGPVLVDLVFCLPKPKAAPKRKRVYPAKRPDLDKLIRSVLDAITHVLIRDDSQVVRITAVKEYGPPGVAIAVTEIVE